jgi:WD repeat-containing protein 40A
MAANEEDATVVVGSRTHLGFCDFRQRRLASSVPLPYNDVNCARSLSWNGPLLTIGGGRGLVSFYDRRFGYLMDEERRVGVGHEDYSTQRRIPRRIHQLVNDDTCVTLSNPRVYEDDERFAEYLTPAIFAHAWDESKTRLVVGGGPLQAVLHGFYLGMWL